MNTYIIAEAGVNHNVSVELAMKLVNEAAVGPDHKASMEPRELAKLIQQIRHVEMAMGISIKIPVASELRNATPARKSVVAAYPIAAGEIMTEANLTVKQPGNGLPPSAYWSLLGQPAFRPYNTDDFIQ